MHEIDVAIFIYCMLDWLYNHRSRIFIYNYVDVQRCDSGDSTSTIDIAW